MSSGIRVGIHRIKVEGALGAHKGETKTPLSRDLCDSKVSELLSKLLSDQNSKATITTTIATKPKIVSRFM
jgi:hypothetical protein